MSHRSETGEAGERGETLRLFGRFADVRSVGALLLLVASAAAVRADSESARFLRLSSQAEFLSGTLEGIAIDPLGNLTLANRAERVTGLDEPFLFAIARHPRGWVAGTGNGGRVLLVRHDGAAEALFTTPEPEVFAVWADPDGAVFAGSSPDGKVYRWTEGEPEVYFDPEETYIWDLSRSENGDLLVATGAEGRLYRVAKAGQGELLYDTEDTHLKTVAALPGGVLLLGTAGEGLILRLAADGSARTLYDSPYPEVVDLVSAAGGVAYAAVLASEASLTNLSVQQPAKNNPDKDNDKDSTEGKVEVSMAPTAKYTGSRPSGFSGPRSLLLKIASSGAVETAWRFDDETVYSLLWQDRRLWVGTGLEGKLFSFHNREMVLEKDVDERQVVSLAGGDFGPAFATTNGAALFRVSQEPERSGRYVSPAQDAGQVSRFGTLMWRGSVSDRGSVVFSARSGMSAEPDRTWSPWTPERAGPEVSLSDVPAGRFVQWRAQLAAGNGESPVLREVVVSYVQQNLPPRIERLTVLPPGEIVVPSSFNAGNQVFEPAHPDKSGIFTALEPAKKENSGRKTLWKKGYRTLRWESSDPNEDDLTYSIYFRRAGTSGEWIKVREGLEDSSFSFDSTVLPDGEYRFLLRAADRRPDGGEPALSAERASEPVVIDHTPPRLAGVERRGGNLVVTLSDALSPLASAEISVDAEDWDSAPAADGMIDGRNETLEIEARVDAGLLLLRVADTAFNTTTYDLNDFNGERP